MCGIVCAFNIKGDNDSIRTNVLKMAQKLRHRGPDWSGIYSDDNAIIGGLALLNNKSVMVFGTEKGNSMDTRIKHNFGMAKPEGYRKAQRLTMLAEKFNLPIISFIDTAGAFPGKDAEERGQSESIANSILVLLKAKTIGTFAA